MHLYADRSRQLGDADSDRRDVLLSCGAVLDHCVVALAANGWHTRLRRFPDASDHDHLALIEIIEAPATEPSRELAALPSHAAVPTVAVTVRVRFRPARWNCSISAPPGARSRWAWSPP